MTAYLGFRNLIPLGIVTAEEMPGFEKENAFDWFTYTWWRGVAPYNYIVTFEDIQTIDYFGLAAHNLNNEGYQISVHYKAEVADPDWITFMNAVVPTNNAPVFYTAPPVSGKTFLIQIFKDGGIEPPYVGVFSMGEVMELPEGIRPSFTPPPAAVNDKIFNAESATGQFLGRSVERFGYEIDIRQTLVDPAWILDNWLEVSQMLSTQPFFYSWNQEEYPDHAVYAWLEGDMPVPKMNDTLFSEFTIKARCQHLIRWF